MIVLIIVVLLLLSACRDWSEAEDWERSEYNAELRHQELLEEYRRSRRTDKLKITKATRKRTARDKHGNILSEEITIEERDSDEIDLDEYDFDDEE
jgi:hypothetical protein